MAGRGFKNDYTNKAKNIIWYTGENLRPPIDKFSGTISFEPNCNIARNLFLPYWMIRLDWEFGQSEFEIQPKIAELMNGRIPFKKDLKVCSFSNRKETTRENLIRITRDIFDVDCFGIANAMPVGSKLDSSYNYLMQICNENDLYPNYVTEKLQEAWLARNVPIWAGIDSFDWFNKDAIINVTNKPAGEIQEILSNLTLDEIMYKQSLPILNRRPSLEPTFDFIRNLIFSELK
jgi:hypothetical protein